MLKPTIQLDHITFERFDKRLFSNLSLTVNEGELLHLKGPNGIGKSTLLKIIATLLLPCSGKIFYQGSDVTVCKETYQNQCHYLGHLTGLNRFLTVYEYWTLYLEQSETSWKDIFEPLDLQSSIHRQCGDLSAGQKQKLGLLRLIVQTKQVWLLDEPWNVLDEKGQTVLNNLIQQHLKTGGIVIAVSHQPLNFKSLQVLDYYL